MELLGVEMSLEEVTLKVTVTVPPGAIVVGDTTMLFAWGGVGAASLWGIPTTTRASAAAAPTILLMLGVYSPYGSG